VREKENQRDLQLERTRLPSTRAIPSQRHVEEYRIASYSSEYLGRLLVCLGQSLKVLMRMKREELGEKWKLLLTLESM